MFTVYVLRSIPGNKRYIGWTAKTAGERLLEHNNGSNQWTKSQGPFQLCHTEQYSTKTEAIRREHFLKSGQGRKWLDGKQY